MRKQKAQTRSTSFTRPGSCEMRASVAILIRPKQQFTPHILLPDSVGNCRQH
jgi:hypothetical protein